MVFSPNDTFENFPIFQKTLIVAKYGVTGICIII